jgi:hypothetical protein
MSTSTLLARAGDRKTSDNKNSMLLQETLCHPPCHHPDDHFFRMPPYRHLLFTFTLFASDWPKCAGMKRANLSPALQNIDETGSQHCIYKNIMRGEET